MTPEELDLLTRFVVTTWSGSGTWLGSGGAHVEIMLLVHLPRIVGAPPMTPPMTSPLLTNGQALAILQSLYQLADEWSAEVSDIHAPASRYDKGATATWSVAAEQLRARLDRLIIADLSPRLCELEREALRRSGVGV